MVRRHIRVPRRKRIFVCAEGQSERSFAKWLKILCDEQGANFYLDIIVSNGGDSLAITEHAIYEYRRRTQTRGKFSSGLILLDSDRLQQDIRSGRDPEPKANSENLKLVYLKPNFEGLLSRLHTGREKQFPTADEAKRNLQKLWPNYRKPPSAEELHRHFRIEDVRRAALHDTNLRWMLEKLGLLDSK